jgi:hypothetical protein
MAPTKMTDQELKRLEQNHPLAYAVMMYDLNPIDHWKDKIRKLYFDIPKDERRFCLGDMDLKDYDVNRILNLPL